MLPPGLKTPREVTLYYDSLYQHLVESGNAAPFLYPWAGIGAFAVIGYLLIDHRKWPALQRLRYPIFVWLVAFEAWVIATNKARHPAGAFGVGLLSAWGVLWVSTIMIVDDCQTDFKRLERTTQVAPLDKIEPISNGTSSNGIIQSSKTQESQKLASSPSPSVPDGFMWQPCPTSFTQRLDWIADVFCNFRGVGWDWQTSTVPPPPIPGYAIMTSKSGIRRFTSRSHLVRETMIKLAIGYLVLDVIKILIHHDAYFWGYMDAPGPSYLPPSIQDSYVFLRSYRLIISLSGMYFALWEIFKLGPIFFAGILGPEWIGLRGEPWMNPPDMFGSFSCVLDQGLAGWWAGWWHQTFRVAFNAHARWLLSWLGIDGRSNKGKIISLLMAFFLSGCLHACASYTQLGETRPLMGPFRFFMLQPVGILVQIFAIQLLNKAGIRQRSPKFLKQTANFIYVHIWFYFTGPILLDDFAKGGVWLYEPIIISPLRALGLGAKDDAWFCWWDGLLFWRSGKHWWDTGIAI